MLQFELLSLHNLYVNKDLSFRYFSPFPAGCIKTFQFAFPFFAKLYKICKTACNNKREELLDIQDGPSREFWERVEIGKSGICPANYVETQNKNKNLTN